MQVGEHRCEITTFRSDSYDPASRKPEVEFGDTIEGDLGRRDFTVNAMAVALPVDAAQPIVDPFGGLDDLVARRAAHPDRARSSRSTTTRCGCCARRGSPRSSASRSRRRAVAAIAEMADRLEIVSAERIRDELTKLMLGADPRRGLEILVETGMAEHCLPEVAPADARPSTSTAATRTSTSTR